MKNETETLLHNRNFCEALIAANISDVDCLSILFVNAFLHFEPDDITYPEEAAMNVKITDVSFFLGTF